MKRWAILVLLCSAAWAQNSISGTITASQCLTINTSNRAGVTVQVTGGSWTGVIQPNIETVSTSNTENGFVATTVTQKGQTSSVSTITGNGVYSADVGGADKFQVCGNTVTNSAVITMNTYTNSASKLGGGGTISGITCAAPLNCGSSPPNLSVAFVTTYLTGQVPFAVNGAQPAFTSPNIPLGNAGAPVTTGAYAPQCDSATTLLDRGKLIVYASGATANVTWIDSGSSGCSGMYGKVVNDGATATPTAMVFTRNTTPNTDTFRVCTGNGSCSDAATTFHLFPGQSASFYQAAANEWDIIYDGGLNGQSTLALGGAGTIGASGAFSLLGSTSGTYSCTVTATANTMGCQSTIELPDTVGYAFSQSASQLGTVGAALTVGGSGATEVLQTTGGASTTLLKTGGEQNFSFTTSTFTTVLSPVNMVQWTLPNVSKAWGWDCYALWSNPAGTTPTIAWGVNWGQAPSIAEQHGTLDTTNPATAAPTQVKSGTTTTTNANFLTSGTLTNSGTLFQVELHGAFTGSATSGTFSVTATLTGTGATGTLAGHCVLW